MRLQTYADAALLSANSTFIFGSSLLDHSVAAMRVTLSKLQRFSAGLL